MGACSLNLGRKHFQTYICWTNIASTASCKSLYKGIQERLQHHVLFIIQRNIRHACMQHNCDRLNWSGRIQRQGVTLLGKWSFVSDRIRGFHLWILRILWISQILWILQISQILWISRIVMKSVDSWSEIREFPMKSAKLYTHQI